MRLWWIIVIIAVLILTAVGVAAYAYWLYERPVDLGTRTVSIIIEPGNTLTQVAGQILDSGVVKSRTLLVLPARIRGIDKKLTPGRYDFSGSNSCRSVLDRLEKADFLKIKITIPEGTPIWTVASILAHKLQLDSAAIIALNSDSAFLVQHGLPALEGFLFPETYFFRWGLDERAVVSQLLDMFHRQTDSLWPDPTVGGLGRYDILTLASIIESETHLDRERPVVSSVYHNRLNRNMRLEADPTVMYGLGGRKRTLSHRDLEKDTPYNTYLHGGLPPTPINSPGLAAIRAALRPDSTDYLFFVADANGGHYFSRTNAEHNRARARARRLREIPPPDSSN